MSAELFGQQDPHDTAEAMNGHVIPLKKYYVHLGNDMLNRTQFALAGYGEGKFEDLEFKPYAKSIKEMLHTLPKTQDGGIVGVNTGQASFVIDYLKRYAAVTGRGAFADAAAQWDTEIREAVTENRSVHPDLVLHSVTVRTESATVLKNGLVIILNEEQENARIQGIKTYDSDLFVPVFRLSDGIARATKQDCVIALDNESMKIMGEKIVDARAKPPAGFSSIQTASAYRDIYRHHIAIAGREFPVINREIDAILSSR